MHEFSSVTLTQVYALTATASKAVVGPPCGDALDWRSIDWQRYRRDVRRLQSRLVQAVKDGRWRTVRNLQRLLVRSTAAKALAVRQVTDNRGKRTPGVDGIVWNTPGAKTNAIGELGRRGYQPRPLRRVYIPKPGSNNNRPLSIPTMRDRAMQALHQQALDPVAETLLESHACGFRQQRSTADAIAHCFNLLAQQGSARWVLEGDIRACFDKISHAWLAAHIPMDKGILRKWLSAGFMESRRFFATDEGTPQGSVISPALMNLTLNGLEATLRERFPGHRRQAMKHQVYLVSYADDFIITGASKALLEDEVKPVVERFLAERGLELSETKTKVTPIEEGFDFLGQHIRKYGNGKLLIKPSRKSQQHFRAKVSGLSQSLRGAPQSAVIHRLNPVIRGWANYHRHVVSKDVFGQMDHWLWSKLWRWASRRHPSKSRRWIKDRYFHTVGLRNWVFRSVSVDDTGQPVTHTLLAMADTPIRRHRKVHGQANPYDPAWAAYFDARFQQWMKDNRRSGLRIVWRRQQGQCARCHQAITNESGWRLRRVVSKARGGADTLDNLVLLHPECSEHLRHDTTGPRPTALGLTQA